MDAHANFASSAVAAAPSPAISGTSLDVRTGEGQFFPVPPFNASVIQANVSHPTPGQAEIVRVTNVGTDTFTVTRAQEGTSARSIQAGDRIVASITGKALTDIEALVGIGQSTFSNADYTMLATDKVVAQIGTMSAARTVSVVAAASVAAGQRVLFVDRSGTVYNDNTTHKTITLARSGSDTFYNPTNISNTTSYVMKDGGGYAVLESNGSTGWTIVDAGMQRATIWWAHPNPVAVPSGVWTPMPWGTAVIDTSLSLPGNQVNTTTIAVASNGVALPTATINVASTTGFASTGYLTITISGVDYVVKYTGKTSTTFTGCNTTITAVATLATGQTVKGANCVFQPNTPYLYAQTVQLNFTQSDTGVRGIAVVDNTSGFVVTRNYDASLDIPDQAVQMTSQPGFFPFGGNYGRIDAYQDSGTTLNITANGLESPLLMMVQVAGQS